MVDGVGGRGAAEANSADDVIAGPAAGGEPSVRKRLEVLAVWRHGDVLGALLLTGAIMALIVLAFGANPWTVARTIVKNSLAQQIFLGQTIMTASLLVLTGLAAAIPFTARLWNIGGEGQMFAGAIVAVTLGITLPAGTPQGLFVLILIFGAAMGGAVWGSVPGLLKAYFDINEIVTSLMLNFLAYFAANYVVTVAWPEIYAQLQSKEIHDTAHFPDFWGTAKVDISVFVALAAALAAWVLLTRTSLGFSIRSIGANSRAARLAGVRTKLVTVSSFAAGEQREASPGRSRLGVSTTIWRWTCGSRTTGISESPWLSWRVSTRWPCYPQHSCSQRCGSGVTACRPPPGSPQRWATFSSPRSSSP